MTKVTEKKKKNEPPNHLLFVNTDRSVLVKALAKRDEGAMERDRLRDEQKETGNAEAEMSKCRHIQQ